MLKNWHSVQSDRDLCSQKRRYFGGENIIASLTSPKEILVVSVIIIDSF